MSLSIKLGHFLFKHAFVVYKPMYTAFKMKQDAFEIELLSKHIHPGDVVLDIGANIGFYASILSKLVGDKGQVHCFEPDATNFNYLHLKTKALKNTTINQLAVSSKSGTISIYTSKELNVDHRTYQPEDYDSEIKINATSIDDYVMKNSDLKVDFIKMDIQGFEMQALKGMEATIRKNPKIKIISEFWPYGLQCAGSSLTEYFNYLVSFGFEVHLLEKKSLSLLNSEKVKSLEHLPKEHYFNILATLHV